MDAAEYVKKRDNILREADVKALRELMPPITSDLVAEITLHKARYEVVTMPDDLRQASRAWLEERSYTRLGGMPWPPGKELPD